MYINMHIRRTLIKYQQVHYVLHTYTIKQQILVCERMHMYIKKALTLACDLSGMKREWEASLSLEKRGKLRYDVSATPNCSRWVGRASTTVPARNSRPRPDGQTERKEINSEQSRTR